jgi:putative endonuclease
MQHRLGEQDGFTKRYIINRLVYFESFRYVNNCIACEKRIKSWSRAKKVSLISAFNPTWEDLAADWGTEVEPLSPKADSSLRSNDKSKKQVLGSQSE